MGDVPGVPRRLGCVVRGEVCIPLWCVFCQRDISEGEPYGCEIYDSDENQDGTCWHHECPADEQAGEDARYGDA